MSVKKSGWAIQKSLFASTNQDSTFSHTLKNSNMFNITSKYFSFFNNKPPASWVAQITPSCLYYCSMQTLNVKKVFQVLELSAKEY